VWHGTSALRERSRRRSGGLGLAPPACPITEGMTVRKHDELTNPASCLNRAGESEWLFVLLERGKNTREDAQIVEAEAWITAVLEAQAR
jgi:hypothetical protein